MINVDSASEGTVVNDREGEDAVESSSSVKLMGSDHGLSKQSVLVENIKSFIVKEKIKYKNFREKFINFLKEKFQSFSGMGRIYYWKDAIRIIMHRPILGYGLNTYTLLIRQNYTYQAFYPHNCYLQLTAELGVVGLLAFGWMIWNIFKTVLTFIRLSQDRFLSSLALGTLSGFFGFLVHSAFDTQFYTVQLSSFMWLIMGMLAAFPKIGMKKS